MTPQIHALKFVEIPVCKFITLCMWFNMFYEITFWKCELWMIKCCDSITVWKTWKDHANIFDIAYAIMNNMENSRCGLRALVFPLQFLVLSNFHSCFYNSMETRRMFSISLLSCKHKYTRQPRSLWTIYQIRLPWRCDVSSCKWMWCAIVVYEDLYGVVW